MTRPKGLDRRSKAARAVFSLVDASQKMSAEIRTRVARVRNMMEDQPGDPMLPHRVEPDLTALMKESRLIQYIVVLRKALRQ